MLTLLVALTSIGCHSKINDVAGPDPSLQSQPQPQPQQPGSDDPPPDDSTTGSCSISAELPIALVMPSRGSKTWPLIHPDRLEILKLPEGYQFQSLLGVTTQRPGITATLLPEIGLKIETSLDPQTEPSEIEFRIRILENATQETLECNVRKSLWIYDPSKFQGDVISFVPRVRNLDGFVLNSENLEIPQALTSSLTIIVPLELKAPIDIYDPIALNHLLAWSSVWPYVSNPNFEDLPLIRFLVSAGKITLSGSMNSLRLQSSPQGNRVRFIGEPNLKISALGLIGGIILDFGAFQSKVSFEPIFPQSVSFVHAISEPLLGGQPEFTGKTFSGAKFSDSQIKGPFKIQSPSSGPALTLEGHTIVETETSIAIHSSGPKQTQKPYGISVLCPQGRVPITEQPLRLSFNRSPGIALSSSLDCMGQNVQFDVYENKSWDPVRNVDDAGQIFKFITP